MDFSNAIVRSFLLSVLTLITFTSAVASVPPALQSNDTSLLPTLQSNATTTVTDTGTTPNLIAADGTTTEIPTSLVTEVTMTTTPSEKPGDVTTSKESVDTTSSQEMTTFTTDKPSGKSGFRVGTFFCVIILIGCLIGIGFCGYQFYRKRQNDNYHTL